MDEGEITILLRRWRDGDQQALNQLMPVVYSRLRAIAGRLERNESKTPTLQATALVHEVYMRLLNQRSIGWTDREHFFSFAAQIMRLILIDHARAAVWKARRGERARAAP